VYTYNADGLRIAQSQSVSSVQSVETFVWDWATSVPEMLSDGDSLYLIGYDTLGWWDGSTWTFALPDALGSVRQELVLSGGEGTDATGTVTAAREWSPYGVEVGGAQAGLGYTGEWFDTGVGLQYLRARWYEGGTGRFTQRDAVMSSPIYRYASGNPVNRVDPTGHIDWPACINQGNVALCIVEDNDSLYKVARELDTAGIPGSLQQIVSEILALNPQVRSSPNYYLRTGDNMTLRATWVDAMLHNNIPVPPSPTPSPTPTPFPPSLPPIYLPPPSPQWYVTEPVADSGVTGDPDAFVDDLREALSQGAQPINLVVNMITDTGEYWYGSSLVNFKFGIGLDFFTQLIADAPLDLCTAQRVGRAAVSAGEGYVVSAAAQYIGVKASLKAFGLTLPLGAEVPWLPPVATGVTYFAVYIPTNMGLSAGFNYLNEEYIFVALKLNPE
jgi:RHS repeat-associated protein